MMKKIFLIIVFSVVFAAASMAAAVNGYGEAHIIHGDISSAKSIAITRAKWDAIGKASGVKSKIDTIISNAELIDEAVKTEISSVVKGYKIADEGKDGNTYWVLINANVVPDRAKVILTDFSKNASVAVFIPAILPDGSILYEHPFSEALIGELLDEGLEVTDIASSGGDMKALNRALKRGDYLYFRQLAYDYMASFLLIGKVNIVSMGNDIGYMKIDFSLVNGELDWRLIDGTEDSKKILASGTLSERGQGPTDKNAAYSVLKNMSKSSVKVASSAAQKILGTNTKTIRVVLEGNKDQHLFNKFRNDVKNIPFVLQIEENGLDTLHVDYPEKMIYFATFITKNHRYSVKRMDNDEIILEMR